MSMHDDIERKRNAFQAWKRDDALGLAKFITSRLEDAPDGAKLVCREGLRADGTPVLWFTVEGGIAALGDDPPGYDASFPCPPFCT